MGDERADEFRARFFACLTSVVASTGGETVKNTGDGLMVVFRTSAVDAIRCASEMHERVEQLDPVDPAFVRIGISAGEVAEESGDWFGTPVVEAARLCAHARAGQTLLSGLVRGLVGSRGGHEFRSVGSLQLKGLPNATEAAEVVRAPVVTRIGRVPATRTRRRPVTVGAFLIIVVAAALVVGLLSEPEGSRPAPLPPANGYTPRFVGTRCPSLFRTQVPTGTCGRLIVPENRSRPRDRQLRLLVTRAPARVTDGTDPVVEINSLVDGIEDVANSPARDHADLLTMETRLFDGSDPSMACPEFAPVGRELLAVNEHDSAVVGRGQDALRTCYRRLASHGVALDRYNLLDSAQDVIDLGRALRLASVNLVASSTTAISAYEVVRSTPPGFVRSLTLESPVAPGTSPSSDPTRQLAEAFDRYLELCAADATCRQAFPNLRAQTVAAWERARLDPIVVTSPIPDGTSVTVKVDGDRVAKAIANVVGVAENGLLGIGITEADATPAVKETIARVAALWDFRFLIPNYPWARVLGSWCSYDLSTVSGGTPVSDLRPELSGVADGALQWLCEAWPVPKISKAAFISFAGPLPTLVVGGRLNPSISPRWAAVLQSGLTHATVVTFPTLGNLLLRSGLPPCLNALRRDFLADPQRSLARAAVRCEGQSPKIDFATPGT